MEDVDAMFSHLLGEIDQLTQTLLPSGDTSEPEPASPTDRTFSVGFKDLNESLNELEDHDLDALVAGDIFSTQPADHLTDHQTASSPVTEGFQAADALLPPLPNGSERCTVLLTSELQTKADKIKVALEKLKEAKIRKLIIRVLMSDGSSKVLMVDERHTVREVLDKLFEKTHCDCSVDWSLCETNPELHTERLFEDHEYLLETLSAWTRNSKNQMYFLFKPEKYMLFKQPQVFYMWRKAKTYLSTISEQAKTLLLQENFEGSALIVPDLEGTLFLKEEGKKVWKPRYFLLRASGMYYVPKGKTKTSSDLACFVQFDKFHIYTTSNYKQRYRAPTDYCFILKHLFIQKESNYIKFLCCDSEHTLSLWVNSIRVGKYGTVLYKNYQTAVNRASVLCLSTPSAWRSAIHSAEHKDGCSDPDPVGPESTDDEECEQPPDFIPPPPPGLINLRESTPR
ncbi:amyloid beta A4 precursor protein-binding family B member 1-interacting protein-like [Thalassophryne amazonica]|uniref:amyloid beta A4 precursor protein-binding family B member 1-interacting protein-like n=1 Tax=Thalassophryne amazonica TaxID=390379 RepID=UPI001471D2BC|nr:amyloid beta A4 precursor protein-binding family B member 1-interacting protein-like [Thalassophryne amazonica]